MCGLVAGRVSTAILSVASSVKRLTEIKHVPSPLPILLLRVNKALHFQSTLSAEG